MIRPLIDTIGKVGSKSMVALVAVEIRSRTVCAQFINEARQLFDMRKIPSGGASNIVKKPFAGVRNVP